MNDLPVLQFAGRLEQGCVKLCKGFARVAFCRIIIDNEIKLVQVVRFVDCPLTSMYPT